MNANKIATSVTPSFPPTESYKATLSPNAAAFIESSYSVTHFVAFSKNPSSFFGGLYLLINIYSFLVANSTPAKPTTKFQSSLLAV